MPPIQYPPRVIEFARRLGERGYTVKQGQAALQRRGFKPSRDTVKRWMFPEYAEAQRQMNRHSMSGTGHLPVGEPGKKWTWVRRLDRMKTLREIGLSYRSIAAVMNHDFNLGLTEDQARYVLGGKISQGSVRALLTGNTIRVGRPPKRRRRLPGTAPAQLEAAR